MIVECGFVEKSPAARLAAVLHLTCVDELMSFQRTGTVEALVAGFAAERCHVYRRSVQSVDNPAVTSLSSSSFEDPTVSFVVISFQVFLQVAVVEESLAAQVTHERLRRTMKKHVRLQLGVLNETLAADITSERFLACVNTNVPLQVLAKGESRPARLTCKRFPVVDRLVRPERSPHRKSFAAHAAFVRMVACVSSPVAPQRESTPETLPAFEAPVRPLNIVDNLVSLQVAFSLESLSAGGADERPRVGVHDLMSF